MPTGKETVQRGRVTGFLLKPTTLITVVSWIALGLYEWLFRVLHPAGLSSSAQVKTVPYLFQNYASDDLLQTVKIADLANFGPMGLWYFHVQPPLHQAILYVLALPDILGGVQVTSELVDMRMYVVYIGIYGLLNALVFMWLRDLTGNKWISWIFLVLWAIYPGNIAMATLLDGTYLSLYLITLMLYFMYRFLRTRQSRYITWWLVAFTVTSYARTIFQIHFMVLLAAALLCFWWMQKDKRRWAIMALQVLLVVVTVALPVQRYLMWGSFSTTTFGGYHRTGMLFYDPTPEAYNAIPIPADIDARSQVFQSDNNIPIIVADNIRREQLANEWIADHSLGDLVSVIGKSVKTNFDTAIAPTSMYSMNDFSHNLPWRAPMDGVLSGYVYPAIAVLALIVILIAAGPRRFLGYFRRYGWMMAFYLVIAGTILLQNRNDWSEAHRLKVFVEIPVWLSVAFAVTLVIRKLQGKKPEAGALGS